MPRKCKAFLTIAVVVFGLGCQNLPYQPDSGFLNPAQAEYYGFPILVNSKSCKDLDGNMGACVAQVKSDQAVVITLDSRPYAYRLNVDCSFPLGVDYPVDVQPGVTKEIRIEPELFRDWLTFTCRGEIEPWDRSQKVSAQWHVRVLVYDTNYKSREIIYVTKDRKYVVLGAHAKYGTVCDSKGCFLTTEKTVVPVRGPVKMAYSESEIMRFNQYGAGPDGQE